MRTIPAALMAGLALALASAAAFAFSNEPAPDGPAARSQFSDPDEVVENLANGASSGPGTEVSTGAQVPSGGPAAGPPPAGPQDAEPVNPGWPAWMVWHQK